jgi:hypothetical protein
LVELDALAALALGLGLEELQTVYRLQFPVLRDYERDTWYDGKGRIVFTINKGLSGVGLDRRDWEPIKQAQTRSELPAYAQEYQPPFQRCNREEDLEVAYRAFQQRYEPAAAAAAVPVVAIR